MAADIFLKLGDGKAVTGESTDKAHKGDIEIEAFTFGADNPSYFDSDSDGGGRAKVNVQKINLTKRLDKSAPMLFQVCCQGKHFDDATLVVRKAGGDEPVEYATVYLEKVCVDSIHVNFQGGEIPMVAMSLSFGAIRFKYKPQGKDGSGGNEVVGGWDLTQNIRF